MTGENTEKHKMKRNLILFTIYLIYTIIMTQKPFEYSVFWIDNLRSFDQKGFTDYIFYISSYDIINNILLFLPFGIFLFHFFKKKNLRGAHRVLFPLLIGFLFSAMLETGQLFLDRSATIFDLVANGTGAWLGYELGRIWTIIRKTALCQSLRSNRKRILYSVIFLYVCLLFVILMIPPMRNDLSGWSKDYHLLIGNEEGLERPWNGDIVLLALYDRQLNNQDIQALYKKGRDCNKVIEAENGLVGFFPFCGLSGDTIYNFAEDARSFYLTGENIQWLSDEEGIRIEKGNALRSPEPAEQLIEAFQKTSEFSVEVWIRTGNFEQKGPARIITISGGTGGRNFTLAQQLNQIHLRVRTMQGGWNGSDISLRAGDAITDKNWHHVVATFHRGVERVAVDGKHLRQMIRIDDHYCPDMFGLGKRKIGGFLFCFVFFFPLSCMLMYALNDRHIFKTGLSITGFVLFVQVIYYILYGQPFGWFFLLKTGLSAGMGILTVLELKRGKSAEP